MKLIRKARSQCWRPLNGTPSGGKLSGIHEEAHQPVMHMARIHKRAHHFVTQRDFMTQSVLVAGPGALAVRIDHYRRPRVVLSEMEASTSEPQRQQKTQRIVLMGPRACEPCHCRRIPTARLSKLAVHAGRGKHPSWTFSSKRRWLGRPCSWIPPGGQTTLISSETFGCIEALRAAADSLACTKQSLHSLRTGRHAWQPARA